MWQALQSNPLFQHGWNSDRIRARAWAAAPEQFSYPGYGHSLGKYRTKSRAPFKSLRMRAADMAAINRLNKKPEPHHPDQLRLF